MDIESARYLRLLRRKITEYFDLDELKTITYDLGVDWDELSGEKKSAKTQSLIIYLTRRKDLEQLLILLREERPNINWPDISLPTITSLNDHSSSNSVLHNLPPAQEYFVGREKEISRVMKILRPYPISQFPIVIISGVGGIGKSTLALEIGHRYLNDQGFIPSHERFEVIVWVSIKKYMLTPNDINSQQSSRGELSQIMYSVTNILMPNADNSYPANVDVEGTCSLLAQHRTLIIIDQLGAVDDPSVVEFLHEIPAPTKVIVTRRRGLDAAYPVRLEGISKEEADKLMTYECLKTNSFLGKIDRNHIFRQTKGQPLAIVWSITLISNGHPIKDTLNRLQSAEEDFGHFVFEKVMQTVRGTKAYDLLAALALSKFEATRDKLGYIVGLELNIATRDEYLKWLEKLSLIERSGNKYRFLHITRHFILADLKQFPDLEARLVERCLIPTLFIDETLYEVWVEGKKIDLTNQEFEVLSYLYDHAGEFCTRKSILESLLGEIYDSYDTEMYRLISTMNHLRQKIEPDAVNPKYLFVVPDKGYKLILDV